MVWIAGPCSAGAAAGAAGCAAGRAAAREPAGARRGVRAGAGAGVDAAAGASDAAGVASCAKASVVTPVRPVVPSNATARREARRTLSLRTISHPIINANPAKRPRAKGRYSNPGRVPRIGAETYHTHSPPLPDGRMSIKQPFRREIPIDGKSRSYPRKIGNEMTSLKVTISISVSTSAIPVRTAHS